ncbi:hypothetical protein [Deinococcus radiotolerans]|uniref:Uncharacterized protein n=1 Tax=Deinococcus radiotolerans TaxID=1309407 RepID=A0ABQ2FKS5_9DEIO|nr:hypothetical protein [Deinococcus radiotolerans]GGL04018.1 hypothetical protein GCM10010844_23300 [Deinococcus radiotolerans]
MNEFARELAQLARELGLAGQVPEDAPVEDLLRLARVTLEELIAQGLLPDPDPRVGCWSAPRSGLH